MVSKLLIQRMRRFPSHKLCGMEGEGHTLDEGLGEGASSVTVTVGCSDGAGAVVCVVMAVNIDEVAGRGPASEETTGGYEGPEKEKELGDSVVRGPLTELPRVLGGRADERAEVPDGDRLSWKYA